MYSADTRVFVYILANRHRSIYTGVTNSLERRLYEHRAGLFGGFTLRYGIYSLVYNEVVDEPRAAIIREKQIKGWLRRRKVVLIESMNPQWRDLSEEWE